MPNALTANGLEVATREELTTYWNEQFQAIYGDDINLGSDTPDGQLIGNIVQQTLDIQDLLVQLYNTFDPDYAFGNTLDQRVAINGIQRQAGTYTITNITLVNTESVNLYGLDNTGDEELYTIADNAGTLWVLMETELGLAAGTHVLVFRAAEAGEVLSVPNTITTPVTIVIGVSSVNNPTQYTTLGINEELDGPLKVRRQRSVSLASQGYYEGLRAALLNINGITSAFVYENTGSTTDSDGIPGHSIWVVLAGTADEEEIAQAIYTKRNAGCGMKGDETYTVTQVDGSPFTVYWDVVITRNLFIKMTLTSIDGIVPPSIQAVRDGLVLSYIPGVNESININAIATSVQALDPNALATSMGVSSGVSQTIALSGIAASGTFKVSYDGNDSATINWNDSIGTINTIVQAVTGLSNTVVTGSIASQSLVFNLEGESDVLGLIYLSSNTLATSAPAAITFTNDPDYQDVLNAVSKQNQYVLAAENIVILAMQMSPSAASVEALGQVTFTGLGGYGSYTYSLQVNNSGGSINATSGLYTAGATPDVTDTVKATDSFGNTATAAISVF